MEHIYTVNQPNGIKYCLEDFDFAVREVEDNYSGFFDKVSCPPQEEYLDMKRRIRVEIELGKLNAIEAVAKYCAWFRDYHMWTDYEDEWKFYPDTNNYYVSTVYRPRPVATKVDSDVYMIRFPSCSGNPSINWIKRSIRKFRWSRCKFLIIDIRGNNGGSDFYTKPFLSLLYNHSAILDGITIRNTHENIVWLKENFGNSSMWKEAIKKSENSPDDFTVLTPKIVINEKKVSSKPYSAAVIIDHNVSSSSEQFLLSLMASSDRITIYGKNNTLGCLDYSNSRTVILPNCNQSFQIPTTRSMRVDKGEGIDGKGIEPQIYVPLDYPRLLEDNIDSWIYWVSSDLKKKFFENR